MPAKRARRDATASSTATPAPAEPSSEASSPPTPEDDAPNDVAVGIDDAAAYDPAPVKDEAPAASPAPKGQLEKLHFLLSQSSLYSQIIGDKMAREREERAKAVAKADKKAATFDSKSVAPSSSRASTRNAKAGADDKPVAPKRKAPLKGKGKAKAAIADVMDEDDLANAAAQAEEHANDDDFKPDRNVQSSLVTGAELRDYQLDGVEWLISLHQNGVNGILADEMGLGKTLQTIAFIAYLREMKSFGPYLIVCPLSTVGNWTLEFERFTPSIPVLLYHGSPAEREELRRVHMAVPLDSKGRGYKPSGRQPKAKSRAGSRTASRAGTPEPAQVHKTYSSFPVVITSYELVMNDRNFLSQYPWAYVIVDESHRLKNLNCRLITELKKYESANRLLLTGTPLHNNLAELWSLLNFILPDIFDNLDSFQSWFDIDVDSDGGADFESEQQAKILANLHAILKPFMLRRLKADVEGALPPKKEYLLQAPLTAQQKELYDVVLNRNLRAYLLDQKTKPNGGSTAESSAANSPGPASDADVSVDAHLSDVSDAKPRKRRRVAGKPRNYVDKSDEQFFDDWENNEQEVEDANLDEDAAIAIGRAHQRRQAEVSINNMKLQNVVMQLRKVCNHPWLFEWPRDPDTGLELVNEELINASGKMLLLDRLLSELYKRGHKTLLFSQFTSQLDIIQDWAEEYKNWKVCRIDGTTKQDERRRQIKSFNEDTGPDAPHLFVLSTRAGGVGINLTGADTVVFFDSDWNPQMDLQAQDRAHRIGQTKPVLIFRLVAGSTVEASILQRAGAKRKLEALVLGRGQFSGGVSEILGKKRKRPNAMSAVAEALLQDRSEEIVLASKDDQLLSDEQLETLLDRSDEAMSRSIGWTTAEPASSPAKSTPSSKRGKAKAKGKGTKTTFEVFETRPQDEDDEAGDLLAKAMSYGADD